MLDYIMNGQGFGNVADRLLASAGTSGVLDTGVLRPWMDKYGRSCVDIADGWDDKGKPKFKTLITNAPATLTKDAWQLLDDTILRVARKELRVWGDIVRQGLTYNVPNGMGTTVLQHQTMTDSGEAALSMDGLRQTNRDRVVFDIANLPLPIVHSDFSFSLREILVSRQGQPIDTAQAEQATRKCMEQIEKLMLGTTSSYSYGGGTIYGLTNFPQRIATTMTLPTDPGWSPQLFIEEINGMIQDLKDINFNGPYGVWYSTAWAQYMANDYSATYRGGNLRNRAAETPNVSFWNEADYLDGFQVLIVQLSQDVIQAVTGMQLRTLQWETQGGLEKNFKVMGIMVPRIRANSDEVTGINHGVAA